MEKLSKSLENYLFEIYKFSKTKEKITVAKLAHSLNFNKPSTTDAIKSLHNKGLIEYIPYKGIKLLKGGVKYAKQMEEKRELISNFFKKFLLLENEKLDMAVLSVEYGIDKILLERFQSFADFLELCPNINPDWVFEFNNYIKNGEIMGKCAKCIEEALLEDTKPKCKICNS